MSKAKPRRRYVLSGLLAVGLCASAGVGGYLLTRPEGSVLNEATQDEMDAAFASVQSNDTLASVASAWQDMEQDSTEASTDVAAAQPPAEEPTSPAPVAPLRSVESGDRYAALPPLDEVPLAEPGDRYTATSAATDEPHQASDTVARGQSPVEPLPDANPLRTAAAEAPAADDDSPWSNAEEAFAEPAPLPRSAESQSSDVQAADPRYAGEAPTEANPLRAQRPAAEAPTEAQPPQQAFDDARPLAGSHYEDEFAAAEPQPMAAEPSAEPMRDLAAETGDEPQAFDDAPTEDPWSSEPADADREADRAEPPTPEPRPAPAEEPRGTGFDDRADTAARQPGGAGGTSPPAMDEGTGRPGERALEGAQRPSLVLQKFAPDEIQVGKECQFVIKVRNVGQRPAENVTVVDEVPRGTQFVSTQPQAETSASDLRWELGTLSPGEERTMEVTLMPTEEGEIGSVAEVSFASHASAKARCTRPQLALRMSAPSEVLIGRQQQVTIELHNPGTGDATGVMLFENVPENVRHQAGPNLEFEVGTLRAGETRRMELVLTAEKAGQVTNVLTARADGNLEVQQEVEFEVIAPALSVDVEGPSRRYLERPATYTVSVDNPGSAPAKDVQLVTKLPRGMQFVRANNLGEYDSATHSIYWSLAELPEGQSGTVELVAMPTESGDHTLEVEGRAREGLEDRTTRPIRIEGLAAIMFTVSDAQDPIGVGGATSYEIRVVNQGTKAASNVRVAALVPPGLKVTGATGETRHAVEADGVMFDALDRLAPKAEAVYRVEVQGVQAGDQRLTVEVLTDDITQPIRKEESTRVFGDE